MQQNILLPDFSNFQVANGRFITSTKDYKKALDFPPFGFGTDEMKNGVKIGSLNIPGLGDPNVPESFSVWSYSVKDPANPVVLAKIKTGVPVGEILEGIPAVGGSSPNSLAVTDRYVFASNGTNDNISVIDILKDTIAGEIPLKLHPAVKQFRGVIPFGLAVSPDQKRLYVAESGINAIGVVDIPSLKVTGHIPALMFTPR